jgi:hypothetical protein
MSLGREDFAISPQHQVRSINYPDLILSVPYVACCDAQDSELVVGTKTGKVKRYIAEGNEWLRVGVWKVPVETSVTCVRILDHGILVGLASGVVLLIRN